MPRGDRTGPWGQGPMTGRGAGYCAGFGVPGYENSFMGRRPGFGFGRGFRNRAWGGYGWSGMQPYAGIPYQGGMNQYGFQPPFQKPDPDAEKQLLKQQFAYLKEELEIINKRLEELDSEKA